MKFNVVRPNIDDVFKWIAVYFDDKFIIENTANKFTDIDMKSVKKFILTDGNNIFSLFPKEGIIQSQKEIIVNSDKFNNSEILFFKRRRVEISCNGSQVQSSITQYHVGLINKDKDKAIIIIEENGDYELTYEA